MINVKMHTFYIWGDSLLKGIIFDEQRSRYAVLENNCISMLSKLLRVEVTNRSKMGCTVTKGNELLSRDLENGAHCEAAILEFGGNDSDFHWDAISANPNIPHLPKTTLADFRKNMESMITLVRSQKIVPILMNLLPIDSEKYFNFVSRGLNAQNILKWLGEKQVIYNFHRQYSVALEEIAAEKNCPLVDVRSAFMAQPDYTSFLCVDGIHPNEKGHRLMQEVFMSYAGTIG